MGESANYIVLVIEYTFFNNNIYWTTKPSGLQTSIALAQFSSHNAINNIDEFLHAIYMYI